MLGLTAQDIIAIQATLDPGARVRTLAVDLVDGLGLITNAVIAADQEVSTERRAARLAVSIQSNQPFTNCNTRTATMCV